MSEQQIPPAPQTAPSEPPAWLASTPFKSPEALADGYRSLQSEYTRLKQQVTQPAQPVQQPPAAPQSPAPSFDWSNPSRYLGDQGFAPDLVEHLSKSGIPKETVEGFGKDILKARQIVQQQAQAKAVEIAGGPDKWKAVQQYIAAMPDGNKSALMGALDNPNSYEYTLRGLVAEMQAKGAFNQQPTTQEPSALPPMGTTRLGAEPLMPGSQELMDAIRDPRYRGDSPQYNKAFAAEVEQRIIAGQKMFNERMGGRR